MELKFYNHPFDELLHTALYGLSYEICAQDPARWCLLYLDRRFLITCSDDSVSIQIESPYCAHDEQKPGEEPVCILPHRSAFTLKKIISYFFTLNRSIETLHIEREQVTFTFGLLPFHEQQRIKAEETDKRVSTCFELKELELALHHDRNGPIISEKHGSVTVVNRQHPLHYGLGFDFQPKKARLKAVLEYLERSAAMHSLPDTIEGCYADWPDRALSPTLFGLYTDEVCQRHGLQPYHDTLPLHWIEAKSLLTNRTYLIPEQICQYLKQPIINQYVHESSNGCAIGNTFTEASYYSLLEVFERDVFMKCWFTATGAKRIVFDLDPLWLDSRRLFFEQFGYELNFYYLENDCNIPVIWGLITSTDKQNMIYSITGLGCHLNLKHALDAAFSELYKAYLDLSRLDKHQLKRKVKQAESSLQTMHDHLYYFASYSAQSLIESRVGATGQIDQSALQAYSFMSKHMEEELAYLLNRLKNQYEDILIVDQTNCFLQSFSLICTKAFLIGATPLDFTSELIRRSKDDMYFMKKQIQNRHPLA